MDRGAWWAIVHAVAKSWAWLSTHAKSTFLLFISILNDHEKIIELKSKLLSMLMIKDKTVKKSKLTVCTSSFALRPKKEDTSLPCIEMIFLAGGRGAEISEKSWVSRSLCLFSLTTLRRPVIRNQLLGSQHSDTPHHSWRLAWASVERPNGGQGSLRGSKGSIYPEAWRGKGRKVGIPSTQ